MTDWCLTCGQFAELEAHHVAGRNNHRALTVALCPECHRVLSGWQLASGVELDAAAERTELDATRALVVGAMQLLQLFAQRHAECSWLPADLLTHSGRAASRMLDGCGPADRPGRWLPDPTVPPCEATPVGWPEAAELARTSQFAALVIELAQILGEPPPIPAEQLTDIAADPRKFAEAFRGLQADESATEQLLQLLDSYLAMGRRTIQALLNCGDPSLLDEPRVEEAQLWFDTGLRLLAETLTQVDAAGQREPS